jgi:hypothetical protein
MALERPPDPGGLLFGSCLFEVPHRGSEYSLKALDLLVKLGDLLFLAGALTGKGEPGLFLS